MERNCIDFLKDWFVSKNRKPLVIRGARQVGKTWIVRHLAKVLGKELIEINFEKRPGEASLFASNDPKQILLALSTTRDKQIQPEKCLLFLDEIQAAPHIFSKLRWFSEDLPELPVIAAGSLLEFLLSDHTFSMPVGRISYMYLEPLTFEEYLLASNKNTLLNYLMNFDFTIEIPTAIHEQLMSLLKEYLLVGGLPAAVDSFVNQHSLTKVNQIHHDLLTTYRDDFAKYRGRISIERLDEVMTAVPKMLGQKFVYSHVNPTVQSHSIKQALNLLTQAKICHRVLSCSANGIPLAAELNEKYFKTLYLDTGLCSAALGLSLNDIFQVNEIILINNGGISEQVVGQLLRTINPPYIEPSSYYWIREGKDSNAEIDYIIQSGIKIIPIEVKAGTSGSLKSLHLFMDLKQLPLAVRINSDLPSQVAVNVKNQSGKNIQYNLVSVPFYLIGQLHRMLKLLHTG